MNLFIELVKSRLGCGYAWGSQGELLTTEVLEHLKNTYNSPGQDHYNLSDGTNTKKWIGKYVYDCSGLFVWALRKIKIIAPTADYTANTLFSELCFQIDKTDLRPGDLVFKKNTVGDLVHVGMYYENGTTIEAMSTKKGVVIGSVNSFNVYARLKAYTGFQKSVEILKEWGIVNTPAYWKDDKKEYDAEYVQTVINKLIVKYFT